MKQTLLILCLSLGAQLLLGQTTLIPDANFEQRLIDLGIDPGVLDGMVPTASINSVTDLWVPNSFITDITGIEDFSSLELLDITGNGITSLDLTGNPLLRELYAETNPISNLDLSVNSALEIARLGFMQLTELDVSACSALNELRINNNQLATLDLSNNALITSLWCSSNQLCRLDLSDQLGLENLICNNNLLTNIDVMNGNNALLTTFNALNNDSGLCIQVDDEVAATAGTGAYGSWQKDGSASYSESCSIGPEINVLGNGLTIVSGDITPDVWDDTDYGTVAFGSFADRTFTIQNTGDADLTLTGSPLVQIGNSVDFTLIAPPDAFIVAGGFTEFTVRYEPSMAGTINIANISINSIDCDESIYMFDLRGESSSTLGVENSTLEDQLKVFPVPSNGPVNIKYEGSEPVTAILLSDISGKIISINYESVNNRQFTIDLRHLKGIYFLTIKTRHSQILRKLVII